MAGLILLLVAGAAVRTAGAAARTGDGFRLPLRFVGWMFCTTGAWMLAGAAGAWSPWWSAGAVGVLGTIADLRFKKPWLWIVGDALVIVTAGLLSVPSVGFFRLAIAAIAMAGVGLGLDRLMKRTRRVVRAAVFLTPFLACAALTAMKFEDLAEIGGPWGGHFPFFGITTARGGERVLLDTGAVALLELPRGNDSAVGALFFHGAHPDGVRQASSCVARRALLAAGFVVLSVDHPGFGESPAPDVRADVSAWDPLPTVRAAAARLRDVRGVTEIVAFGHSLGAMDVFRLLGAGADLAGAVVSGTGIADLAPREDYWYGHFHRSRALSETMPRAKWRELNDRYYLPVRLIGNLEPDRCPMLFVHLGRERASDRPARDAACEAIPQPKTVRELVDATHQYSAMGEAGVLVGDTRVTGALALALSRFHREVCATNRNNPRNQNP